MRRRQEEARAEGRARRRRSWLIRRGVRVRPGRSRRHRFLLGQLRAPASFNGSGLVRVNPDATVTVVIGTGPPDKATRRPGHKSWAMAWDPVDIWVCSTATPASIPWASAPSGVAYGRPRLRGNQKVKDKAAKIAAHLLEAWPRTSSSRDGGATWPAHWRRALTGRR